MPTAMEMLAARYGILPPSSVSPELDQARNEGIGGLGIQPLPQQPVQEAAPAQQNQYDQLLRQMQQEDAIKRKRLQEYLTMNKQGLAELEDKVKTPQESRTDLSPLLALSDTWFGGNLQKGYRPPPTKEEARSQGINEMAALQQRKEALTKLAEGADTTGSNYIKLLMAQQRQNETNQRADEKKTAELSNRIEKSGLADLDPVIANINKNIPSEGDISGFGLTAALPDILVSKSGTDARQAVGGLRNIVLKARSGGAVTPSEADRMLEELGAGTGRTDEQLRVGITNVVNQLAAKKQAILGGYRGDIKEAFKGQGGNTSVPSASFSGGLPPEKQKRLQELRAKKEAGNLK